MKPLKNKGSYFGDKIPKARCVMCLFEPVLCVYFSLCYVSILACVMCLFLACVMCIFLACVMCGSVATSSPLKRLGHVAHPARPG